MKLFGQEVSPQTLGLLGAGLGGILGATSGKGQTSGSQGYTGGIPEYTATRTLVPGAFDSTDRRPGQAGRRYFSDVTFTRGPDNAILGGAELEAMNQAALEQQQAYEAAGKELLGLAALQQEQAEAAGGIAGTPAGSTFTPGTTTVSTSTSGTPAGSTFTPGSTSTITTQQAVSNPLNDFFVSRGFTAGTQKTVTQDDLNAALGAGFTVDELAAGLGTTAENINAVLNYEYAAGGLASLGGKGYYLGGPTDGMADLVPATIDGTQPAALSDGEFVIPADVVSHLGNGNSDAGAQQLYSMMDRVRTERTGTTKQGPEINPMQMMPA